MPERSDTTATIHLTIDDALELAELLTFLSDWLDSPDTDLLAASLHRFAGTAGYDLADLQIDLDRFAAQLSGDRSP
jgi:hypothetical protein